MRGDLRRIWARPAARLLSRPRDRPRQARLGARPFLANAGADLAGLSADPAPDAEGARVRGFHGRAVSIVRKPQACAAVMTFDRRYEIAKAEQYAHFAASRRGGGADQRSAAS